MPTSRTGRSRFAGRLGLALASGICGTTLAQDGIVVVDRDDVVVTTDAIVQFTGVPIHDDEGDGVLRIEGDGLVIRLIGTLEGVGFAGAPEDRGGTGVVVRGERISIGGGTIRGFSVGLDAAACDELAVVGTRFEDGRSQRLDSTVDAEFGTDWLRPHANDGGEWATTYGAALRVRDASSVSLREIAVRRWQNGIMLERVTDSIVADCDASFLSGWGLALWRSSNNLIARNAFDFCVRGYSHEVYNRGQDSAGLLMFEGCHKNAIVRNSITHGGDGIFAYSGHEATGEVNPRDDADWYRTTAGHRGNLIAENDLSYAVAHGIELTFATDNRITRNRIIGNGITGIWGGYSQDLMIDGNEFAANGEMPAGDEHGAINIENGVRASIVVNRFRGDSVAVQLWNESGGPLDARPWVKATDARSRDHVIGGNTIEPSPDAGPPLRVRDAGRLWTDLDEGSIDADPAATAALAPLDGGPAGRTAAPERLDVDALMTARGLSRGPDPRGNRESLTGRHAIVMGPYGPWDHEAPLLRLLRKRPLFDEWEIRQPGLGIVDPVDLPEGAIATQGDVRFTVRPNGIAVLPEVQPVVSPYRLRVNVDGHRLVDRGTVIRSQWNTLVFPWQNDPIDNYGGWFNDSQRMSIEVRNFSLAYTFGFNGPSETGMGATVARAKLGVDRFGLLAHSEFEFPPGRWRIVTRSDDGIRVRVNEVLVIEDWTIHAPRVNTWEFESDIAIFKTIDVEYFERDGYALLDLKVEPADWDSVLGPSPF
ncbi:MAG: right-handed parallel beta-helix repeat-containing protein [Phycisphaerales bacterium]